MHASWGVQYMYGAIPTSTTYATLLAGIRLYSPTLRFAFVTFYNPQVAAPNRRDSAHETDLWLGVFYQSICHNSVKTIICFARNDRERTRRVRDDLEYREWFSVGGVLMMFLWWMITFVHLLLPAPVLMELRWSRIHHKWSDAGSWGRETTSSGKCGAHPFNLRV